MNILDPRALKANAEQTLERAPSARKILPIYLAVSMALTVLLSLLDLLLSSRISGTSGLSGMSSRAILSTAQTVLPYVSIFFALYWDLGYQSAMLRISRGQQADEKTLLHGFSLFGPALRSFLLQSAMYVALLLLCSYAGSLIFMMLPLSDPLTELLTPFLTESTILSGQLVLDDATMLAMMKAMLPALALILIVYAIAVIPIAYRLRMVNYALLDAPRAGAFAAIRASRAILKGHCKELFKLDLSFWWYYLLTVLASVVCYGDSILALFGVELPIPASISGYVFYALYVVAVFAINLPLRNRIEQVYALAYDALRPKPQSTGGVVLGNIFDLAKEQ